MPACAMKSCKNHSDNSKHNGISFHIFPKNPVRRDLWKKAVQLERQENNWMPSNKTMICSIHFKNEDLYFSKMGFAQLKKSAVPVVPVVDHNLVPKTQVIPFRPMTEQCRFCGEFRKRCILISDSPYLLGNRTMLALNKNTVVIDFSGQTLPNTVCKGCVASLQQTLDFIKVVQKAQSSFINTAVEEPEVNFPVEHAEIETLIVKTECDSDEQDDNNDHVSEHDNEEETNDSLTVSRITQKRKCDAIVKKAKIAKVSESDENYETGTVTLNRKSDIIVKKENKSKVTESDDSDEIELKNDIKVEVVDEVDRNDDENHIKVEVVDEVDTNYNENYIKLEVVDEVYTNYNENHIKVEVVDEVDTNYNENHIKVEVVDEVNTNDDENHIKVEVVDEVDTNDDENNCVSDTEDVKPSEVEVAVHALLRSDNAGGVS